MSKSQQSMANAETVPPQSRTQPGGMAKEPTPAIPLSIGDYRIDGLLGKGGMGFVYEAFDQNLQRKVAIKTILPTLATDEEIIERFLREARLVAQLSHDNICQIYAMGRLPDSELPYFVMEFIEGKSLQEKLVLCGAMDFEVAIKVVKEAAIALNVAFEKGIIHRDIKPANIMIGHDGAVTVTDFGLAKLVEGGQELTAKDVIVGTPHYMAPECALEEGCDHRADIYSLGATFFHMLAGRVPFEGPSALSVLNKHANDPIPSLRKLNSNVPQPLVAIVERMLAKAPEDRFNDYNDLIASLDGFQRTANNASEPTVAVEKVAKKPSYAPMALAIMLLLCAIGFHSLYGNKETTNSTVEPMKEKLVDIPKVITKRNPTSLPPTKEALANSPKRKSAKGTVHLFLLALHLFTSNEDRAKELFPLFLPIGEASSRTTWYHLGRLRDNPHWIRSYLGGTPENGYECKELLEPLFDDRQTFIGEDRAKVFLWSSGRDLSVPVTLRRNNEGNWKLFSWSSLIMGVKRAKIKDGDF